jgi:hypothetical protein
MKSLFPFDFGLFCFDFGLNCAGKLRKDRTDRILNESFESFSTHFWILGLVSLCQRQSPQNTLACLPPSRRCAKHPSQYYEFATNACGMWGRRRRRRRCAFSFLYRLIPLSYPSLV